jgi:hypothetical protein
MYRGKNKSGVWIYGNFIKHQNRQPCAIEDSLKEENINYLIARSGFADWGMTKELELYPVNKNSIGERVGLKDLQGKDIYDNHIVEFGFYREGLACRLKGKFSWNDDSLRYELDIFDNYEFACLWYDNLRMGSFEIVGDYEEKF